MGNASFNSPPLEGWQAQPDGVVAKPDAVVVRKDVRAKDFESYNIPVPAVADQERIVSILDKFDALTNSLGEGLPREIALRQKQCEYYRDLLLSFSKPEEVAA